MLRVFIKAETSGGLRMIRVGWIGREISLVNDPGDVLSAAIQSLFGGTSTMKHFSLPQCNKPFNLRPQLVHNLGEDLHRACAKRQTAALGKERR